MKKLDIIVLATGGAILYPIGIKIGQSIIGWAFIIISSLFLVTAIINTIQKIVKSNKLCEIEGCKEKAEEINYEYINNELRYESVCKGHLR